MDNNYQTRLDEINRIKGSMLGFAIGDALGATVEFMHPDSIKQEIGTHKDIIGGGWLKLEPGEITDDTEMTLCVARSLVDCGGYNLKDIADKFVVWYNGDPVDIGSTCRAGIHRYIRTGNLEAPYNDRAAGNGGVMRELPLILRYANDREFMLNSVVSQSRLTHNNKESDLGCQCYAELVAATLSGASKEELRDIAGHFPLFDPEKFDGKSGGYVVETLRTVLHYFFVTSTFENCIVSVVNRGEDADTTGALAGGLAGAFYGLEPIPARWLGALDRDAHQELLQLAERVATMTQLRMR